MIDLMQIPASEAERLAYMEGFKGAAELFRRIADLEATLAATLDAVEYYHEREGCPELLLQIGKVLP